MSITRPRGEQIVFSSSKTGDHSLDTYLEGCEKGTKTIGDLLDQIFSDDGQFSSDIYQFRENPSFAGRLQVRINPTIDPLSDWSDATQTDLQTHITSTTASASLATDKAAIATTKAAEAAASALSAATSEGLATSASNSVTTNLPAINQAIANAASINFPTPTAADYGQFISVAEGGGALIFKASAGGSQPYIITPTSPESYMVKAYEVVPNNFTPTLTWQVITDATLHISDLASINSDGNYIESTKTITDNFLFYDDLTLAADANLTISGSGVVQGIAGSTGIVGLSGSESNSILASVMTQAQLITSGAI